MPQEQKELIVSMDKLNNAVCKQNNLFYSFGRGVLNGLGFFVGSAVLAAVLIYILAKLPDTNSVGHFLHNIVDIVNKRSK